MAEKKDPKQRILEAAISLFARKGYAAVGIREIAGDAGVNISMISYYFNGKVGILESITNQFHDKYYQVIRDVAHDESLSAEQCVRIIIRDIVNFLKAETELALVVFNMLPFDIPELSEIKARRVSEIISEASGLLRRFGLDPESPVQISIIGPYLFSIIFLCSNNFK